MSVAELGTVGKVRVFSRQTQQVRDFDEGDLVKASQLTDANTPGEPFGRPVAEIRDGLRDSTSGGVVIVGVTGSGRRAVFDEALALLDPQPSVIHLSGSSYVARMRHGVISFVLSQLESDSFSTRHELVHGLSNLLCPDGRRSVVTLGNPSQIDAESAAILAQLAAMKKIWLVAVCERLGELPTDLLSMQRSGGLKQVVVQSMDVRHTRRFLEKELGGPISMFAAAALWRLTSSNRDLLRSLVRELVASGKLRLQSGSWVFAQGALRVGPALRAQTTRWTSGVVRRQRDLLDLLALGGPATSAGLRAAGLEDHVAGLRARGLVSVGERPAGLVRLRIPLLGDILREDMDEGRRPEVEAMLGRIHRDPKAARLLTEVTAMRELGNFEALVAVVEEYEHHAQHEGPSSESWLLDSYRQLRILEQTIDALVVLGWHGRATSRLSQAQESITTAQMASPGAENLLHARQSLRIMRARLSLVEGRPTSVERILSGVMPSRVGADERSVTTEEAPPVTLWASEALHFRAMAVQAEAWAMTSQHVEALQVVRRIRADMDGLQMTGILDQVMTESDRAHIETAALRVQLLIGRWKDCAADARTLVSGRCADSRAIEYADIVLGILGALGSETGSALGVLLPAQQQLALHAESSERAAVEAAVAYCLTEEGRADEAAELLLDAPPLLERMLPVNFFSWSAEVMSALAVAGLGSSSAARQRVRTLAEKAERAGSPGLVVHSLVMALRLGDRDAAPRLERLAAAHSGQGFQCYGRLAQGIMETDSLKLCESLEELSALGQTLHSGDASNMFIDTMAPKERRRVISARSKSRHGEPRSQATNTTPVEESVDEPAWLAELTKREAQIALHVVSGLSNAEIARQSGVSVRTVEGHLYQVYSKLQVRNRQELAGLDRVSRLPLGAR